MIDSLTYKNLVQIATWIKSCGLLKEAARLLVLRAIDEAYTERPRIDENYLK